MPSNENLANLLADHPFGDERDLLCTIDRVVTVGEAKALVAHLATRLVDSGVRPGEGVAVQLPSDPDLVVAMLAIWSLGAVFVPLNDRSPRARSSTCSRPSVPPPSWTGAGCAGSPRRYTMNPISHSSPGRRGPLVRPRRFCNRTADTSSSWTEFSNRCGGTAPATGARV